MAIKWYDVVAVAPRLTLANAATQTELLRIVNCVLISDCVWGELADTGRKYLAAHLGTLALLNGAGPLTAEKVGELSRSYGTVQGIKGSLGTTTYGAEYERLTMLLPTALGAVY